MESGDEQKMCMFLHRKLRALWSELNCPKPNFQGSICPPIDTTSEVDALFASGLLRKIWMTSARETMTNEAIEGNEWAAYGALDTYHLDETRDHLRARAYGDRALIVLVRVTTHQGRRESRLQGEAAQVEAFSRERARDVRNLNRRNASTGEPDDTENGPVRFGKGPMEKG